MSRPRRVSIVRHLAALFVLSLLDLHGAMRRRVGRTLLRTVLGCAGVILVAMVATSLTALSRVARTAESLLADAMIGLESAVALRAVVRESQLELVRLQLAGAEPLTEARAQAFRSEMTKLLETYRRAVFDEADAIKVRQMEQRFGDYAAALAPLLGKSRPAPAEVARAEEAVRNLVAAVEEAYQFNRASAGAKAIETRATAARAMQIARWLWGVLAGLALATALVYGATRWLAVPAEPES